eukprot:TRINITY_DN70940_c0_g1_i1.p1 TRINITY_DN70940_c0_g1~~TRINITY_DN70940_c0_g1_i1.p1  ORF type:complete len:181 (+),score=22.01 TRINITY_DN70940_c0_g1_i1:49-591(+)
MARIGVANFGHSADEPVKSNVYWRQVVEREQRGHVFSALNEPFPQSSYKHLNTTSNDFHGRTWALLDHTRTPAAGKSSFHHNVAKPHGSVKASATSASFERPPMSRSSSGYRVGPGSPSHAAATHMLGNSRSMPSMTQEFQYDRLGSGSSSRRTSERIRGPQFNDAASVRSSGSGRSSRR